MLSEQVVQEQVAHDDERPERRLPLGQRFARVAHRDGNLDDDERPARETRCLISVACAIRFWWIAMRASARRLNARSPLCASARRSPVMAHSKTRAARRSAAREARERSSRRGSDCRTRRRRRRRSRGRATARLRRGAGSSASIVDVRVEGLLAKRAAGARSRAPPPARGSSGGVRAPRAGSHAGAPRDRAPVRSRHRRGTPSRPPLRRRVRRAPAAFARAARRRCRRASGRRATSAAGA